jgi:hypothetical protein
MKDQTFARMNRYVFLLLGMILGLLICSAVAEDAGYPKACISNQFLQTAVPFESPEPVFEDATVAVCFEEYASVVSNEPLDFSTYQNNNHFRSYSYRSSDSPITPKPGIRWKPFLTQMVLFTTIEQATRMTSERTRMQIKGPFLRDWMDSVNRLRGWSDGGKFFTNYVAHPLQGSTASFIYKNNDTRYNTMLFSPHDSRYWKMTGSALAFSAVHSLLFEIGPYSEASIGNVGMKEGLGYSEMAMIDLVITPTIGTALFLGEDAIDKYLSQRIERGTQNGSIRVLARILFNPTRSLSNVLRFKSPAYRDDRR